MKISCGWIYAISKYGYPPSLGDTYKAIEEMAEMGFKNIELEGIGEENLKEIVKDKEKLKKIVEDLDLRVVNFCPVLPDIVSVEKERRDKAVQLFKIGIDTARYFNCLTIQTDSFTPSLKFIGEAPYKKGSSYGKEYKVKLEPDFNWQEQWKALVDTFAHCTSLAKDAGLKFCLEPRVGELISNTDAVLRLIDAIGDNNFGVLFDTAHQHTQRNYFL
ncbi:sugar phosphate isomerase/epimerase [Candidatus Aerophobetes bacterium]|nr:sugar phosphate isomerase/epimerase [Candidatus Aerophobetes bacterium]